MKDLPTKERWQPMRCGIVNIFRYDEETFLFEDGHLLLRGSNGSGKSRVLALTLPFLFDGQLDPSRMEPDRDRHKRVDWNLLMNTHSERTGYTWIEFGRMENHRPHFLTLGCGMRAVKGRTRLDRWFFTTSQRIGDDLELVHDRRPLTQRQLEDALGTSGQTYATGGSYRQAVNQKLFHLSDSRYDALINLLIELRQPQLSRKFEEKRLSAALSEALPPLPESTIRDVAEALRSLDQDRQELHRLQTANKAIAHFLQGYRRYTQAAAHLKAERVMHAHNRHLDVQRKLTHTQGQLKQASLELDQIDHRIQALELEEQELRAKIDTLSDSPEMRKARDLERARSAARDSRKRRDAAAEDMKRAKRRLVEREERQQMMEAQVTAGRSLIEEQLKQAEALALRASLSQEHERVLAQVVLPDPLDSASVSAMRNTLRQEVRTRRQAIQQLEKRAREKEAAERALNEARRQQEQLRVFESDAEEALDAARDAQSAARDALIAAWRPFIEACKHLKLPDDASLYEAMREWADACEGVSPMQRVLSEARDAALQRELAAQADARQRQQALAAAQRELEQALAALDGGRLEEPPRPLCREPQARSAKAGAPLWQVVDFAATLAESKRAPLEAALLASGLLDAWIHPDGRVERFSVGETSLIALSEPIPGPNLGKWLQVKIDPFHEQASQLQAQTVQNILSSIGTDPETQDIAVDFKGRWRLGPLHGKWQKERASFIGEGARQEARRQREEELRAQLQENQAQQSIIQNTLQELARNQQELNTEAANAPQHQDLRDKQAAITAAQRQLALNSERVQASQRHITTQRQKFQEAQAAWQQDTQDLMLPGINDLQQCLEDTLNYERTGSELCHILEKHVDQLQRLEERVSQQQDAQAEFQRQNQIFSERQSEATTAESHYQTLEANVDADVSQVRKNLAKARQAEKDNRQQQKLIQKEQNKVLIQQTHLQDSLKHLQDNLTKIHQDRQRAILRLQDFAQSQLLHTAYEDLQAPGDADWQVKGAVQLAGEILDQLPKREHEPTHEYLLKAWRRHDSGIHQIIAQLFESLLPLDFEPYQDKSDDLMVVLVPVDGEQHTMFQLFQHLEKQIQERRTLLTTAEQAVLEKHLIGEITRVLSTYLNQCDQLVTNMNHELATRPTSSGLTLRFKWKTGSEAPADFKDVRKSLMQNDEQWTDEVREALAAFMQARIEEARQNPQTGTWQDHLQAALDYRQWHAFSFEINDGQSWRPLNRRSHGEKSGGEKVTALMLLQLAAAASHYRSAHPHAPRLILLDEAFVGVDDTMRGQCMGFMATFDLDFIMTSEREKGCYESLPGVAIAQLASRPGLDAIHVTQMIWNGRKRSLRR